MKLFGFNISVSREAQAPLKRDATQYALSAGLWPDEGRTGTVLSNAYEQVVWVYRAINALAEQVSKIPFSLVDSAYIPHHIPDGLHGISPSSFTISRTEIFFIFMGSPVFVLPHLL